MTIERSPTSRQHDGDTALAATPGLIGQVLGGRYRVTSLLGEGGMGAVYRAEHTELKKPVALKVLNQEMASHREAAKRFEREAMVSAQIQHPNVVSATDSGRLPDGSLYLVLEYIAGHSLRQLLEREKQLPPTRALWIGAQIADALGAAHREGVVHRDLKPGNVMLLAEDQPETVKVLDFGLARVNGESPSEGEPLTRTGSVFGTPEYMSPEQARGEVVDHRADLYALGVILYELLSGKQPFVAPELVAILIKHIQEPPPPLPADVPEPIARYVMSLLDKDPNRRPSDARQVAKSLRRLAPPAPGYSEPPSSGAPLARAGKPLLSALRRVELRAVAGRAWHGSIIAGETLARWSSVGLSKALGSALARRVGIGPQHRRRVVAALGGVLVTLLLGYWLWPSPVSENLRQRARQGEPAALGQLAQVPAPDRGAKASIALSTGYFKSSQYREALDALENALDLDEDAGTDPELLRGLRRAVDAPATRVRALELAAKRLGPQGADLLYDVWSATGAKTPATRAAREWLDSEAVREHASDALKVALVVRETKTCAAVLELLPRVTKHGDERSLPALKRLQSTSGCGFLSLEDCYSCLRKGTELDAALGAVATRPAPKL
ncbi:MAG TPA: protein kinase [Polyangiaceae bacterium]|nr:protein kinase [Polyangiaceae bacterium]